MELHKNARSCPASRLVLVDRIRGGMSVTGAASAAAISRRTAFKWKRRYQEAGEAALVDRSSRPSRMPRQVHPDRVEEVIRLRRRRYTGPQIAARVGLCTATVARILARHSLSRLKSLEPKEPVRRYQRQHPGELIHVDIKKLGRIGRVGHRIHGDHSKKVRGIGWEFVHVAIDDASRLSYAEVLPNERSPSSTGFLKRSVAWFQSRGVRVQSVMSDNGSCYVSHRFKNTCLKLKLRHLRTRPYRPQTNGKAERFIQTLLREWAYKRPYSTSVQRTDRLPRYLNYYNLRRPHASLNKRTPTQRLREQPLEN
jgi:transposase InsO family protein